MPAHRLRTPVSPARHRLRWLAIIPQLSFLAITAFAFNVVQCLAWVVVRPFNQPLWVRFNRFVSNTWGGYCLSIVNLTHQVGIEVSGDPTPEEEIALVLSNHQDMPDVGYLMFLGRSKGCLGDMKYFVKNEFKYIPGIGWGMSFMDNLFVKRQWAEDKTTIDDLFRTFVEDSRRVWIMLFPEGTRITPEKLERAQGRARRRGRPVFEHLLPPKTRGFEATVAGMSSRLDAIYDVTIGYRRGVPTMSQYLCGYVPVAYLHVRRFPIAGLPDTSPELGEWLHDRWAEKDRRLAEFYRTGSFPPG